MWPFWTWNEQQAQQLVTHFGFPIISGDTAQILHYNKRYPLTPLSHILQCKAEVNFWEGQWDVMV